MSGRNPPAAWKKYLQEHGCAPKRRGKNVQWELAEQKALWVMVKTRPWHRQWIHLANERRYGDEAKKLWSLGVQAGVPDNFLFMRRGEHCGAVSELKRIGAPPSQTTKDQLWWLDMLAEQGWCTGVHYGAEESIAFFDDYVARPA